MTKVYLIQDDYIITGQVSNGGDFLYYVWYNDNLASYFPILADAIQYVLDNTKEV